jgi:fatty acid/phospholipid biosynthesis enzyme
MLREQLKPPSGGVFPEFGGIFIKSHAGFDAEGFAGAINLGLAMALQELHSKIKQTLPSAVRRRGKRRTL